MKDLNSVGQVIWRASPDINDRYTRPSSSIILPLLPGCHFSDWDNIVFVMRVVTEDAVKTLPLSVPEFQRAASPGRQMTLEPEASYRDAALEPDAAPSALATKIGYESDTEFRFLSAPEDYGLQQILGITKVGGADTVKSEKKVELLLTAIGG